MMSSCNNNNNSVVAKYQPPASAAAAAAAGVLEAKQEQQSSVDSSVMAMARPSRNGAALPSFNDILWCTDVDGDVMTAGMDVNMHSTLPMTEESLDDLSEIVGPELANLVNGGGGAAATTAGNALTTLQPPAKVTAGSTGQQQQGSGEGGDLSDLKSSDLIQTLSAVIDIDKMFADFQSDHRDHQQISTFSSPGVSGFTATSVNCSGGVANLKSTRIQASHDANGNKLLINTTTTTSTTTSRKVIITRKPSTDAIKRPPQPPPAGDNNNNSGEPRFDNKKNSDSNNNSGSDVKSEVSSENVPNKYHQLQPTNTADQRCQGRK